MFGFVGLVCLISVEQEKMDKSAFEQKARTWREKAVSASLHYGAGREEAEDIAQDVMLRLWQMHDELERYQSVEAIVTIMARGFGRSEADGDRDQSSDVVGDKRGRSMAGKKVATDAHHPTHLIIYAASGTAQPRRDSLAVGYRNNVSKHTVGKGKTYTVRRNKTEE